MLLFFSLFVDPVIAKMCDILFLHTQWVTSRIFFLRYVESFCFLINVFALFLLRLVTNSNKR